MIPGLNISGVLPPFIGQNAATGQISPYQATLVEVVQSFGTSDRRKEILRGLLRLRADLIRLGITDGFQWLDGSFVERKQGGGEPGDVDIVTFHRRPPGMDDAAFDVMAMANLDLFDATRSKVAYDCDAYYVDLGILEPEEIVDATRYWFNLFSHRRITSEWKGMVRVDVNTPADDAAALALLALPPSPNAATQQGGTP